MKRETKRVQDLRKGIGFIGGRPTQSRPSVPLVVSYALGYYVLISAISSLKHLLARLSIFFSLLSTFVNLPFPPFIFLNFLDL